MFNINKQTGIVKTPSAIVPLENDRNHQRLLTIRTTDTALQLDILRQAVDWRYIAHISELYHYYIPLGPGLGANIFFLTSVPRIFHESHLRKFH